MFGNRGGDNAVLIWWSGGYGRRSNPGDMWVNRYDTVFVHVIPGLPAAAYPPDNVVPVVSVCGERKPGVDRDAGVMHVLPFSMHEGPG